MYCHYEIQNSGHKAPTWARVVFLLATSSSKMFWMVTNVSGSCSYFVSSFSKFPPRFFFTGKKAIPSLSKKSRMCFDAVRNGTVWTSFAGSNRDGYWASFRPKNVLTVFRPTFCDFGASASPPCELQHISVHQRVNDMQRENISATTQKTAYSSRIEYFIDIICNPHYGESWRRWRLLSSKMSNLWLVME